MLGFRAERIAARADERRLWGGRWRWCGTFRTAWRRFVRGRRLVSWRRRRLVRARLRGRSGDSPRGVHHAVDREKQRIERRIVRISVPARKIKDGRVADARRRRRFDEAGDHGLLGVDHALRGVEERARPDRGLRPHHKTGAAGAQRAVARGRAADRKAGGLEHLGQRLRFRFVLANTNYEHVRHDVSPRPQAPRLRAIEPPSMEHAGPIRETPVHADEKTSNNGVKHTRRWVEQFEAAVGDAIARADKF